MKIPSVIQHIFNPNSRKVGFGYQVFFWADYAAFFGRKADGTQLIDASTWLLCVSIAAGLIGGGTAYDTWMKAPEDKVPPNEVKPEPPVSQ